MMKCPHCDALCETDLELAMHLHAVHGNKLTTTLKAVGAVGPMGQANLSTVNTFPVEQGAGIPVITTSTKTSVMLASMVGEWIACADALPVDPEERVLVWFLDSPAGPAFWDYSFYDPAEGGWFDSNDPTTNLDAFISHWAHILPPTVKP